MPRSRITKTRVGIITMAILDGNYAEVAYRLADISESTYYRWLQQGEADAESGTRSLYRELWESLQKADAQAEADAVRDLRNGTYANGTRDWKAAATFLERRYPSRWIRRTETTVVAEVAAQDEAPTPIEVLVDQLSELRAERRKAIAAAS